MKYNKNIKKTTKNTKTEIKKKKQKYPPKKPDTTVAPPIISTDPEVFWKKLDTIVDPHTNQHTT